MDIKFIFILYLKIDNYIVGYKNLLIIKHNRYNIKHMRNLNECARKGVKQRT